MPKSIFSLPVFLFIEKDAKLIPSMAGNNRLAATISIRYRNFK
jgi:hypothetical protein